MFGQPIHVACIATMITFILYSLYKPMHLFASTLTRNSPSWMYLTNGNQFFDWHYESLDPLQVSFIYHYYE
jgi:hypothetical protein